MHVQTLGALEAGIKPVKPKNLLLLCYLALEGKQDRKHLQMLFWPEAADPATSLRVALSYLQGLGKDLFRSVQNQVEALIQTDAHELTQFYQQQQYSEVIRLYSGAFLKGLDLKNSSTELEDWIFETREKLASLVQWSVLYEAQKVRYSMPDQFQALAEQFFQIDGAPPPTLEMLRFLYTLGLEGYLEHRVLKEAAELGVDLTTLQVPQKTNLQTAIRPVQVFVGRDQELQLLHERLQQTPPAIMTVTGLGGVGKSTLVRAYCAEHHPEDTLWLKADGLKDASGLLHQLGLNVQQADPWVGLTDTLRYHKGIVVIDGADQLSGLDHLQNWLRFPELRVIVTCRQPLQLPEESLLKLEPFSIQEYRGMGLSEVMNHPAVQCFEKHARRNHAAFKIRPEDAQDVVHLCAALSGLPLALEMASSWTQILSLKELREEVQQVVDPEGDPQSLKPIFEASWNLLSEQEKQALTNLNCFLGSFTREAAVIVSGVQLRTLQQLVRKSLLQLEPGQRFRVPQVLKGFISEPGLEIRQKYEDYHLHLLSQMEQNFNSNILKYAEVIPDLLEVVRKTIRKQEIPTKSLMKFFEKRSISHYGLQFYSDIISDLTPGHFIDLFIEYAWLAFLNGFIVESMKVCSQILESCKTDHYMMQVFNIYGYCLMYGGRYEIAQLYFKKAFDICEKLDDSRKLGYGLNLLVVFQENDDIYNLVKYEDKVKDMVKMYEDDYSKMHFYDTLIYLSLRSGKLHASPADIDSMIKESCLKGYKNIELHLMFLKARVMFLLNDRAVEEYIELILKSGELHSFTDIRNSTLLLHIECKLKFDHKISVELCGIVISNLKSSKDRFGVIELLTILLNYVKLTTEELDDMFKLILDRSIGSRLQRRKLDLAIENNKKLPAVESRRVVIGPIFTEIFTLLNWLDFKDRLELLEDHLHPLHLPEEQYQQGPHPRSQEPHL